jgi:hypothetical protein
VVRALLQPLTLGAAGLGERQGDLADAVGAEERPGAGNEPHRGVGGFVVQGLGVGQPRVAIQRGVEVGVADLLSSGGPVTRAAAAVDAPATAIRDAADLLHVHVHHVPG